MIKLSVTLLFIGLSLLAVCNGSPLSGKSSNSNELNGMANILGEIREQCIKNTGSDEAFDGFMISSQLAMMCVGNIDIENFLIDIFQLTNATRGTFFPKYCQEMRSIVSCLNEMLPGMQPCLKESSFQIADAFIESLPEALDLACKNDGEVIMKLEDKDRKECIKPNADQFWECGDMLTNGIDNAFDLFKLNLDHCSELTSYRECINEQLEPCDLLDIVNIFDIPINAILPLTPCANHTDTPNVYQLVNNSIVRN
ncbi:27 kDa glycoprotein-like [Anopheles aquasalis]|uniref:27 kDa glycoprotein-like n=1 Tax=Anopheles aquasalis TaxID=42839 RepID=UPI00215B13A8|nr:27 kDa glycoprotein-like [Anopheles aquasalis]